MDMEWKQIPSFPDYEVSEHGEIRRVAPDRNNHKIRILKSWTANHGYPMVTLIKNRRKYGVLVHRAVCEAFHGPAPSPEHQVAHGDGVRTNPKAANLRWVTRSENMADCEAHGTLARGLSHGRTTKPERTPRGEKHGACKISEEIARTIKGSPHKSGRALAEEFGISPASVSMIRSGKNWSHL